MLKGQTNFMRAPIKTESLKEEIHSLFEKTDVHALMHA
jgi:hypothetical protein